MFFKKRSAASGPVDYIVVGLGNPDKKYENTRHNAGFIALKALADACGVTVDRAKFQSLTGRGTIGDKTVLFLLPQTYMNNSGKAVREAVQFYKLPPERVIVLFDDITLPVGGLRVRRKGSSGGQKGMQSIITETGSDAYPRVRIGIGAKPHPDYDLAAWVLSSFTPAERALIDTAAGNAAEAVKLIVDGDIDGAMNRFSR